MAVAHESPGDGSTDRESILSKLSDRNDIPSENGGSLNSFLIHAIQGLKEIVKWGKDAARRGIKATYAVKIGQKQSTCTQNRKAQVVRDTLNVAPCNGRGLDQWLKHVHNPNKEGGDQSSGVVGEQPRSAVIFEEEEESSKEESAVGSDKEEEDEESSEDGDEEFGGREYESSDNNPSNKSCRNSPEPAHIQSQSNPSSSIQPPIHQPSITFAPEPLCEPVPDLEQLPIVPLEPELKFLPSSLEAVKKAHKDISLLLKPSRRMGAGYKDPELDLVLCGHLELMKMFLWAYMESEAVSGGLGGTWMAMSLKMANAAERALACTSSS